VVHRSWRTVCDHALVTTGGYHEGAQRHDTVEAQRRFSRRVMRHRAAPRLDDDDSPRARDDARRSHRLIGRSPRAARAEARSRPCPTDARPMLDRCSMLDARPMVGVAIATTPHRSSRVSSRPRVVVLTLRK
jgi:hypothetical protein